MSNKDPLCVIRQLAEEYGLLYLDPDKVDIDTYKAVVLKGADPGTDSLDHFEGDEHDVLEVVDTPAGPVKAVTLWKRHDFEVAMRDFFAAKNGPLAEIPATQGAAMITVFNWNRINSHLASFPEEERGEEFRRFTQVKSNYIDNLVVLSVGPYSHVDASLAGHSEEEWLLYSDKIRRNHELTHFICRRLYPDNIDEIRDELIADTIGLYSAYGSLDPDKIRLFLGIKDGKYIGGRLENYTDDAAGITDSVNKQIDVIAAKVEKAGKVEPFDLIPILME